MVAMRCPVGVCVCGGADGSDWVSRGRMVLSWSWPRRRQAFKCFHRRSPIVCAGGRKGALESIDPSTTRSGPTQASIESIGWLRRRGRAAGPWINCALDRLGDTRRLSLRSVQNNVVMKNAEDAKSSPIGRFVDDSKGRASGRASERRRPTTTGADNDRRGKRKRCVCLSPSKGAERPRSSDMGTHRIYCQIPATKMRSNERRGGTLSIAIAVSIISWAIDPFRASRTKRRRTLNAHAAKSPHQKEETQNVVYLYCSFLSCLAFFQTLMEISSIEKAL